MWKLFCGCSGLTSRVTEYFQLHLNWHTTMSLDQSVSVFCLFLYILDVRRWNWHWVKANKNVVQTLFSKKNITGWTLLKHHNTTSIRCILIDEYGFFCVTLDDQILEGSWFGYHFSISELTEICVSRELSCSNWLKLTTRWQLNTIMDLFLAKLLSVKHSFQWACLCAYYLLIVLVGQTLSSWSPVIYACACPGPLNQHRAVHYLCPTRCPWSVPKKGREINFTSMMGR